MYYNIVHVESVDEFGNKFVNLKGEFVPPEYDDLKPSDMSPTNQEKAGVKMSQVGKKIGCALEASDMAEAALFTQGESVALFEAMHDQQELAVQGPKQEPNQEPKTE